MRQCLVSWTSTMGYYRQPVWCAAIMATRCQGLSALIFAREEPMPRLLPIRGSYSAAAYYFIGSRSDLV